LAEIAFKTVQSNTLSQLHLQQSGIGLVRDALEEFISVLGESEQKEQLQGYLEEI
jgi:HSP90 family molecular chaperone